MHFNKIFLSLMLLAGTAKAVDFQADNLVVLGSMTVNTSIFSSTDVYAVNFYGNGATLDGVTTSTAQIMAILTSTGNALVAEMARATEKENEIILSTSALFLATNLNTASTIVKRDASGNFSAGTITANLTGNASGTAATVTTAAQPAITSVGTLSSLLVSGNVGIGISPTEKLDIIGSNYTTTNSRGQLFVRTNNEQAADLGGTIAIGGRAINGNSTPYAFGTISGRKLNGVGSDFTGYLSLGASHSSSAIQEHVRIIGVSGRVGIGIVTPDQKLTVAGNISTTGQIISSGTGNNYFAGNVGIGTTAPTSMLYVSSTVSAQEYIDRTDYPDSKETAYTAIQSMGLRIDGKGLDHEKMSNFVRHEAKRQVIDYVDTKEVMELVDGVETPITKEIPVYKEEIEYARNLTATVSALTEVVKDLIKRIEILEGK